MSAQHDDELVQVVAEIAARAITARTQRYERNTNTELGRLQHLALRQHLADELRPALTALLEAVRIEAAEDASRDGA